MDKRNPIDLSSNASSPVNTASVTAEMNAQIETVCKRELQEANVRTCMQKARTMLKSSTPIEEVKEFLKEMINVEISFKEKFQFVNVHALLYKNHQRDESLVKFMDFLTRVIKMGHGLLLEESRRPRQWRNINLLKYQQTQKMDQIFGALPIMEFFGFQIGFNWWELRFPLHSEPDVENISRVLADLVLLQVDLEAYKKEKHPCDIEITDLLFTQPEKKAGADNVITMVCPKANQCANEVAKREPTSTTKNERNEFGNVHPSSAYSSAVNPELSAVQKDDPKANVRKCLLQARTSLKSCAPIPEVENILKETLDVDIFIDKYQFIDVHTLLWHNNKSEGCVERLFSCLSTLIYHGRNLLLDENMRPKKWRRIKFDKGYFKDKLDNIYGSWSILRSFGYQMNGKGTEMDFPLCSTPDVENVSRVLADLVMLRMDLGAYANKKKPHLCAIEITKLCYTEPPNRNDRQSENSVVTLATPTQGSNTNWKYDFEAGEKSLSFVDAVKGKFSSFYKRLIGAPFERNESTDEIWKISALDSENVKSHEIEFPPLNPATPMEVDNDSDNDEFSDATEVEIANEKPNEQHRGKSEEKFQGGNTSSVQRGQSPSSVNDYKIVQPVEEEKVEEIAVVLKCGLCDLPEPNLYCQLCRNHYFCTDCDLLYHRHPQRREHVRIAVEDFIPPEPEPLPSGSLKRSNLNSDQNNQGKSMKDEWWNDSNVNKPNSNFHASNTFHNSLDRSAQIKGIHSSKTLPANSSIKRNAFEEPISERKTQSTKLEMNPTHSYNLRSRANDRDQAWQMVGRGRGRGRQSSSPFGSSHSNEPLTYNSFHPLKVEETPETKEAIDASRSHSESHFGFQNNQNYQGFESPEVERTVKGHTAGITNYNTASRDSFESSSTNSGYRPQQWTEMDERMIQSQLMERDLKRERFSSDGDDGLIWQCKHCTYANPLNVRICGACCKTTGRENETIPSSHSKLDHEKYLGKSHCNDTDPKKVQERGIESKPMNSIFSQDYGRHSPSIPSNFKGSQAQNWKPEHIHQHHQHSSNELTNDVGFLSDRLNSTRAFRPQNDVQNFHSKSDSDVQIGHLGSSQHFPSNSNIHSVNPLKPNSESAFFQQPSRKPFNSPVDFPTTFACNYNQEFGADFSLNHSIGYERGDSGELNVDEILESIRQEKMKADGLILVRMLREAQANDFSVNAFVIALNHCGNENPIEWLFENWDNMVDSVIEMANDLSRTTRGYEVGRMSPRESEESLESEQGDIYSAVMDCLQKRLRKVIEIEKRWKFNRMEVVDALTAFEGDTEKAYLHLLRKLVNPFVKRIHNRIGKNGVNEFVCDELSVVEGSARNQRKGYKDNDENSTPQQRRARMLLAEKKVSEYSQAEIASHLIELEYTEEDALMAATECGSVDMALTYLQQECELCANVMPMGKMFDMYNCTHRCCRECAIQHFTYIIRDRNIMEAKCPFCNEPDLSNAEIAQEYFNNLDIQLKNLIEPENHELFQKKLRDMTLMKDPKFRWCPKCSSGFIAPDGVKRLLCPDCNQITCIQCRKEWEPQHENITCEQFAEWKEANDAEFQEKGLEKHLEENGIDCPQCRFRYALAKGGCMHFTCTQCRYNFCSGCGQAFRQGAQCTVSDDCIKLGFHAHHPRNCLFYLRDKDPAALQNLLRENEIVYNTDPPSRTATNLPGKCQVMEQKETVDGLKDDICGIDVNDGQAGLCKLHYVEYLVGLINENNIDTVRLFDVMSLLQEFRRQGVNPPEKAPEQMENQYKEELIRMIIEQFPLIEPRER